MKWLSAVLTFVNLSVLCGLFLGMAGRGLNVVSAWLALVCGAAFAVAAYLGTSDTAVRKKAANQPPERKSQKASDPDSTPNAATWSAIMRYRHVWFWAVAVCFSMFAVRSFCWFFYIDGSDYKIQSPNNLGDLSLHLTLIKNFANGVALWPDNPIYVFSKLRYPAGIDLFNALLSLVHVDLITGLVWVGLVGSLATFYAFYRWGGSFAFAGFLFNGGIAGFQFFKTWKFLDYQGTAADVAHRPIAWNSIPLAMFVTQRGWLYAIPVGLVLLWHWREKFFGQGAAVFKPSSAATEGGGLETAAPCARGPLPFWVELSLYASMPLFNLHTFIALTIVLVFALLLERPSEIQFVVNTARKDGSRNRSADFAPDNVAGNFPRRAYSQTRRGDAGHRADSSNIFCLACHRSFSCSINTPMASRLGAGFARFGSAFFPDGRNCEFWIVHHVWVAVAKNMERRHRSIFSVLVNKLRLVDSACAGPRRLGRMAYLEIGLALG